MRDNSINRVNGPNVVQEPVPGAQDGLDGHDGNAMVGQPARANAPNAAPVAAPVAPSVAAPVGRDEVVQTTEVVAADDSVRWGPVWAGLLTALTVFLVLELLAYGLGLLTTTNSGSNVSASGASPWISGILGLIAFFVGGLIAGRASAARGGGAGLLNGFLVWALGTGLILVLSVFGLGSLFGALGSAIGQLLASGGRVAAPGSVNANQVAQISQNVALGAFFSLVLSAIAAALGGMLGAVGRATGRLTGHLINRG